MGVCPQAVGLLGVNLGKDPCLSQFLIESKCCNRLLSEIEVICVCAHMPMRECMCEHVGVHRWKVWFSSCRLFRCQEGSLTAGVPLGPFLYPSPGPGTRQVLSVPVRHT